MSLFTVTTNNARLHAYLPKHGKAEDATRTCELQIKNAVCLPSAAAAVLLATQGGVEVERAFFDDEQGFAQRFYGISEIASDSSFNNKHMVSIDGRPEVRIALLDKIRLRFEGGPQKLVWADFSLHLEDPSMEDGHHYHAMINRDVKLKLIQSADLVDEMHAKKLDMKVDVILSSNGELDLDRTQRDADQIDQAAKGLAESAEIPLKTNRSRKATAKKAAARKRAPKKAA